MEVTKELVQKVLSVVDAGLSKDLGKPVPGQMCVEAAVCYAMGLPHSDSPTCVGSAVREFEIGLNDARWPSEVARAKGMRKLSIAQLGSEGIDQQMFAEYVVIETVKQLLPLMLRKAAELAEESAEALEKSAIKCEAVTSRSEALAAAREARKVASYAATYAAADSIAAAAADAYAADAADAYAADAAALLYLELGAKIGLDALIHCQSPGAKFLWLCEGVSV